jgi:hypothetical protein
MDAARPTQRHGPMPWQFGFGIFLLPGTRGNVDLPF